MAEGQRRQNVLRFFELGHARVNATGSALPVRPAVPMHICVDGSRDGIAARFFQSAFTHPQHGVLQVFLCG